MEIGEYFIIGLLVWWTNSPPHPQKADFFRTKYVRVGAGSGLGLGLGLELESKVVFKVVFWAFYEVSLLITLEPHAAHTNFPDFYVPFLSIMGPEAQVS